MRIRGRNAGLAVLTVVAAIGCAKQMSPAPAAPAPAAPAPAAQNAGRAGAPPQQVVQMPDSVQASNDRYVAQITAAIAGKENLPAEQVFKDIQLLKGTPASRLLAIMNTGYSKGLGVGCQQCHDVTDFASNVKGDKKEARGMIKLVNMINENSKTISEFNGEGVTVNCTVCHRGGRRPVRNLPGQGGPGRGGPPGAGGQPPVRTGD